MDQVRVRSAIAQNGWYCVYLFDAVGERVFLSLTHGSTRFEQGQYVPRTDEELASLVRWARGLLADELAGDPRALLGLVKQRMRKTWLEKAQGHLERKMLFRRMKLRMQKVEKM